MKRFRFTEEQIVAILKEADAGGTVKDVCRRHGVAPATYYQWNARASTTARRRRHRQLHASSISCNNLSSPA
jgi:transposase-like protein